jgi:hypothetical protein
MMIPKDFEDIDTLLCGDTLVMIESGLNPDLPKWSGRVTYISSEHPERVDQDGIVPDNCPRNPGFSSSRQLGCFGCAQATASFNNGNTILVNLR